VGATSSGGAVRKRSTSAASGPARRAVLRGARPVGTATRSGGGGCAVALRLLRLLLLLCLLLLLHVL
jgi:hypothetical protein